MAYRVTKIQILNAALTGQPIFYCHSADQGHNPSFKVEGRPDGGVMLMAEKVLFKVKRNPETNRKNRVDVYMSLAEAGELGNAIRSASVLEPGSLPQSTANPAAARRGGMELPHIEWSRYARPVDVMATTASGIYMTAYRAFLNIDLEYPHGSHVRMKSWEVHLGMSLGASAQPHDPSKAMPHDVPVSELQTPRGRAPETNPVSKVDGNLTITLTSILAASLGALLQNIIEPVSPPART